MREKVKYLAGVGVPQSDIAKIIGCAPKTLRRRFRDELDRGVAEANATVAGYLFNSAKAGNIAAIIFWLKSRARWRERPTKAEEAFKTPSQPTQSHIVILPYNGRHPPQDRKLEAVLIKAQDSYYEKKRRAEERDRADAYS